MQPRARACAGASRVRRAMRHAVRVGTARRDYAASRVARTRDVPMRDDTALRRVPVAFGRRRRVLQCAGQRFDTPMMSRHAYAPL